MHRICALGIAAGLVTSCLSTPVLAQGRDLAMAGIGAGKCQGLLASLEAFKTPPTSEVFKNGVISWMLGYISGRNYSLLKTPNYIQLGSLNTEAQFQMLVSKLDFGQKLLGLAAWHNAEHWIIFNDLACAFEHQFHATEISEGCPTTFDV